MPVHRQPGTILTDHRIQVPLDHAEPGGEHIEVFAREVVAAKKGADRLPWLLFLQGGPGNRSPRPLGSDGWLAQYKQNVADFYEHAGKGGAPVVIMGLPNLRDDGAERHAELVNGIYHEVAANERDVSVTYIAPWHLTNDDGSFASFGKNLNGQTVQIRAPDGLHFTQAGYDVLARYLEPTVTQALAAAHVKLSDTCLGG